MSWRHFDYYFYLLSERVKEGEVEREKQKEVGIRDRKTLIIEILKTHIEMETEKPERLRSNGTEIIRV